MAAALPLNKFRLITANLVSGSNIIYQENIDVASILLSCQITNIANSLQSCDVAIEKSGSNAQINLLKDGIIPINESLNPLAGKIVLEKNDAFIIKTTSSGSLDVVLSVLENSIN
jgi:hypothetical protein